MNESLRKRYNDVICDLKHTDFQKSFSIPFTAEGLKPVNIGCLNTRSGCYIGIPSIYDFKSVDDISNQDNENLDLQVHNFLYESFLKIVIFNIINTIFIFLEAFTTYK